MVTLPVTSASSLSSDHAAVSSRIDREGGAEQVMFAQMLKAAHRSVESLAEMGREDDLPFGSGMDMGRDMLFDHVSEQVAAALVKQSSALRQQR